MAELAAPVQILSEIQREALVSLFFVGEMFRQKSRYVADGMADVTGVTMSVLHKQSLVKLIVAKHPLAYRLKQTMLYRHSVGLTKRGVWFAQTIISKREADTEAFARAIHQAISPCAMDDATLVYEAAE